MRRLAARLDLSEDPQHPGLVPTLTGGSAPIEAVAPGVVIPPLKGRQPVRPARRVGLLKHRDRVASDHVRLLVCGRCTAGAALGGPERPVDPPSNRLTIRYRSGSASWLLVAVVEQLTT